MFMYLVSKSNCYSIIFLLANYLSMTTSMRTQR